MFLHGYAYGYTVYIYIYIYAYGYTVYIYAFMNVDMDKGGNSVHVTSVITCDNFFSLHALCVFIFVCVYIWADGWVSVCVYVCVCVYAYVCVRVCTCVWGLRIDRREGGTSQCHQSVSLFLSFSLSSIFRHNSVMALVSHHTKAIVVVNLSPTC